MSAKVEKQVSLPSGNSTTIQHHHQQQSISNDTTTQNSLDIINNKNSEKILTNNSNTNINNNNNNNNNNSNNIESKDEVDFVRTKTYPPPTLIQQSKINNNNTIQQQQQQQQLQKDSKTSSKIMNCEVKSSLKSSLSTLEKFSFFTLNRKHHNINQQQQQQQQQYSTNNNNTVNLNNNNNGSITTFDQTNGTIKTHLDKSSSNTQNNNNNNNTTSTSSSVKQKFVKSASIARLLGHTYNTKKIESELLKYKNNNEQQQQQQQQQQQVTRNDNKLNKNTTTTICKSNDHKLIKKNFGNISGGNNNNHNHHNNNNQRCIERFQMCTNIQDELITNNNSNNNNNSNQYASASYNNNNHNNINKYNTNKNKTNYNETNQLSINNINNCNNCISQNLNNSNSNLNQNNTKSHICNCNNNNNSNNKYNTINRNNEVNIQDFQDDHYNDISAKAFRTISRSIGKLWWKRTHSVEISAPDPEYKVSYLGNVLTGWAKGDGCVEKPLNTLWRNYTQNHKPDVIMRVRVCASGLKATTRQHGLTEYWSNRITHCCSPKNYSRVFCWIYRHEGRKLKHELRCHAILCSKESIAQDICNTLRENLDRALHDFKREKILKQNARLSLANSVYENPSLPRRKILLSVGGNNYRPPMERSKSAPKLMAIEEAIGEEDGEEIEQTNEPEMKSCCQKDSLYPAMTLGRRRCRRGHSIRRTGRAYKTSVSCDNPITSKECLENNTLLGNGENKDNDEQVESNSAYGRSNGNEFKEEDDENSTKTKSTTSLVGSDDDDFEKLLHHNNYDTLSPLAGELLSYFDMKLNTKTSSLTDLCESLNNGETDQNYGDNCSSDLSNDQILYEASLTTDPSPRPRAAISLENLDNCSDGCEGDCGAHVDFDDEEDELYYRQTAILNLLHRNSLRKLANLSMSSDDSGDSIDKTNHHITDNDLKHQHHNIMMDSDEGSISSGCETASTVTANCEDSSLKYIHDDKQHRNDNMMTSDELSLSINQNQNLFYTTINDTNNQRQEQSLLNDNELNEIKISNKIMQFQNHINNHQKSPNFYKNNNSTRTSISKNDTIKYNENSNHNYHHHHHHHHHHISKRNFSPKNNNGNNCNTNNNNGDVSDSEFSDESGYVEFQDQFIPKKKSQNNTNTNNHHQHNISIATSTTSPSSTSSVILLQ